MQVARKIPPCNTAFTRWQDYAEATSIDGKEKVIQLLEYCDDNFRKHLTCCAGGSLACKPITKVKAIPKKLAVREENTMVARVELHNMQQNHDKPIWNFGARLRCQAGVCKFTTKCPNYDRNVDHTEHIIRDILTRGPADQDIQLDFKPPMQLAASTAKLNKKKPRINNQPDMRNVTTVDNADMVNVSHQQRAKQPAQRTGKLMVTVVGQTISTLSVSTKRKRNTTRLTTHVLRHLTRRMVYLIHYAPPHQPPPVQQP